MRKKSGKIQDKENNLISYAFLKKMLTWALVGSLFAVPTISKDGFYLNLIITTYMNIIMAISLNLIFTCGKLSLAHGAFMAIGAYTSATTSIYLNFPFALAFISSGFAAAIIAWLIGKVVLKAKGVYFVLVSFAFGEVVNLFFVNTVTPFGGATGIPNIPPPRIQLGSLFMVEFSNKASYYYLVLIVTIVSYYIIKRIKLSAIGEGMRCSSNAEHLAECTGLNTYYFQNIAFTIGSFFAGLTGSLFAHYYRYISPDSFTFWESVNAIVINVVGGIIWIEGAIFGAIFLVPLPELLRGFVEYQRILYGMIIIAVLIFLPEGLYGAYLTIRAKIFRFKENPSGVIKIA